MGSTTVAVIESPFQALNLALYSAQTDTDSIECIIPSRGNVRQTGLVESEVRNLGFGPAIIVDVKGEGTRPWVNSRTRLKYRATVESCGKFNLILGNYFSVAGWSLTSSPEFRGRVTVLDDGVQTLQIERDQDCKMVSHFPQMQKKKRRLAVMRSLRLAQDADRPVTFYTSFGHQSLAGASDSIVNVDWSLLGSFPLKASNFDVVGSGAPIALIIGTPFERMSSRRRSLWEAMLEMSVNAYISQNPSPVTVYIPHRRETKLPNFVRSKKMKVVRIDYPIERFIYDRRLQIASAYAFQSSALATARRILGPEIPLVLGAASFGKLPSGIQGLDVYVRWWKGEGCL